MVGSTLDRPEQGAASSCRQQGPTGLLPVESINKNMTKDIDIEIMRMNQQDKSKGQYSLSVQVKMFQLSPNMLKEVGRLAQFVRKTGRPNFQKGGVKLQEGWYYGSKGFFFFSSFGDE